MDSIILNSFGGNGSGSSLFPEFDTAAQIGSSGRGSETCRKTYSKCHLSSEDLRFEAMDYQSP